MSEKKLTIDLDTMLDGYDGLTRTDYKWKIVDDPKNKSKFCYEVRILKHQIRTGQRLTETITNAETVN